MSSSSLQTVQTAIVNDLSLRAKLLLKLERFFPVVQAPHEEEQLAQYEFAKAVGSYAKLADEAGGLAGKTVLDFGCGWGGETAWLAQRSKYAVGCDVNSQSLVEARRFRDRLGLTNMDFVESNAHRLPLESRSFDIVLSTNVFEHVMNVPAMLREIHRVLRPGGAFLSTFGPLFYSPRGYHLCWATQVPWAHLWLGLGPIIEVRNLRRKPMEVSNWRDTGLNMMTFAQFSNAVQQAGFEVRRLRRVSVQGTLGASHLPILGELFTFGVDCHLITKH